MTNILFLFSHKKLLLITGFLLATFLGGLYVFQLNSLTELAYRIAETEQHTSQLQYENSSLQAKTFQAVSLQDLDELAKLKNFEKISYVSYIQVSNGPVAQQ